MVWWRRLGLSNFYRISLGSGWGRHGHESRVSVDWAG